MDKHPPRSSKVRANPSTFGAANRCGDAHRCGTTHLLAAFAFMRSAISSLTTILAVLTLAAHLPAEEARTWDLRTSDTEIRIGIFGDKPTVQRLAAVGSSHNWIARPVAVPLMDKVWIGDREITLQWRPQNVSLDSASGCLTLAFANADPQLTLRSVWRARSGRGPVEHWLEIENRSGSRLTVAHQDSLSLHSLDLGGPATLWWIKRGGSNASTQGGTLSQSAVPGLDISLVSNCEDGASPVPWLAVQAERNGAGIESSEGLYVGWEFSGLGRIAARAQSGLPLLLDLDVGNQPEFKTDVMAGETHRVPAAFVGCYRGDLDEGSYSLHRFVVEKLRPPVPSGYPDPVLAYNLYLDAGGNRATEADVLRSAGFCDSIGFEAFMPDAMWFPETGDWRWDPARFPRGVGPIEEFVHRAGGKLALWCAWTNGGISSHPDALSVRGPQGHPDWFNADFAADWQPGPFYGGQLCLGCDEARDWAEKKTKWLVGNHKLDYLKHDIGPIVTRCNRTNHRHRNTADASYWAALGYYQIQTRLRQAYPDLILENCSGGGHIKDFGVAAVTHYTVATDTLSNLPNRQAMYDSTFAMPPLVLQCYTYDNYYPVRGDNPGNFLWRSAMMGAWQIDPTDTAKWTEEEKDSTRRSVEIYREWIRPMLADVKVHHVLPRPDGVRWDGMFYWNERLRRGTLYVWRPESPESRQTVKLKGLDATKSYWLWCEDGSIAPGVRRGEELMRTGLELCLPQTYASDLVFVQDESLGKPAGLELPGDFRLTGAKTEAGIFSASARFQWGAASNARSYRLTVAKDSEFREVISGATTGRPAAALDGLPPGQPVFWRVEAISWGGRRQSSGPVGTCIVPQLKRPAGLTFLSDIPWQKATAGADNPVRRDVNYYGKPIAINGRNYPKGLWTHAFPDATPADIVYDLPSGQFRQFKSDVGLDDAAAGGSVQFQVLVDGAVKADSGVLQSRKIHSIQVDLSDAHQLTLRVLNGGDGHSCDHAAWGAARLLAPNSEDPLDEQK